MKKRIIVVVISAFSLIMAGCGSDTESEQKGNSVTVEQYTNALKKKGGSVFGPQINIPKEEDRFRRLSDEEQKRAYDEIK